MIGIKQFLETPEIKAKIEKRKAERESYTPQMWEEAKKKIANANFPEELVASRTLNNPDYQPNKGESHEAGHGVHSIQTYIVTARSGLFEVSFSYTVCPTCPKMISKKIVLTNNIENLAFIKWFVRNGEEVSGAVETKPSFLSQKANFDSLVDSLNAPLLAEKEGENK